MLCAYQHLLANVDFRGDVHGVLVTRRHLSGYLRGIPGAAAIRQQLNHCKEVEGCLAILDQVLQQAA